MRLLLDTDTCIYVINRKAPATLRRFQRYAVGDVGVSSVTVAELAFGAAKSARPDQNSAALEEFLLPLEIAAFDSPAAKRYGAVRADLERKGTPIGPLDTLIAAHALALGATLVTHNTREFSRVHGLTLVDWSK